MTTSMAKKTMLTIAVFVGAWAVSSHATAQEPGKTTSASLKAQPAQPVEPGAEASRGSWTGFITDTHCGKRGANEDHTAACVLKCMRGGSKPQIWNEADQKIHDLDSFEKVKGLVGQRVTVKGTLDVASNLIRVESAEKAVPAK